MVADRRQAEVDAVGQAGTVNQNVPKLVGSMIVDKPLKVIQEEALLPRGISKIFREIGDLRA